MSLRRPDRGPCAVGVKATLTVQVPFEAMLEPHVFVCEKSPVMEKPHTVLAELAVFVIVIETAAPVEPTSSSGKARVFGEKVRTVGRANSYAPISTVAIQSPSPSRTLSCPSMSVVGKSGRVFEPASMAGEVA